MRADKWLWCIRAFRTRTAATAACDSGHVTLGEQPVKPARELRPGDLLEVWDGHRKRFLRHVADPKARQGPTAVAGYCKDETPPEDPKTRQLTAAQRLLARPKGSGRPTKRERRRLDQAFEENADWPDRA